MLDRAPSDVERSILALPVQQGGLNIILPQDHEDDYNISRQVVQPQ